MKGLDWTAPSPNVENKFQFNGKEKQTELGLHQYDFHARGYDYQINRTWQIDPHGENYYSLSPYSFLGNNPIKHIDPDGKDYILIVDHENKTITVKATYYVQTGDIISKNSASQAIQFWNDQSGQFTYTVGKKEEAVTYTVNFNLTVKEADNPAGEATNDRSTIVANSDKKTPDESSNTYAVRPDFDKRFKNGKEGKSTNGVTTGGKVINVKSSRKNTDTGAHEIGHSLGLNHYGKGILTSTSNSSKRGNFITGKYIRDIIKNANTDKIAVGNITERGNRPEKFFKGKGDIK
jgi:RHS repeat-associated protein